MNVLPSDAETSDNYHLVIAQLSPRARVIDDGSLQWILQRRDAGGSLRPWRGVSFHQDRDALIRTAFGSGSVPAALAALPARYPSATAIKPPDALAARIKRSLLVGRINHAGELALLVPVAVAADELGVSPGAMLAALNAGHVRVLEGPPLAAKMRS